jgi:quinol monooxygenase YgiN
MSEPIMIIDSSEIREGKLQDVKRAIQELVDFVDANEPQAMAYNVYLNEDGTRMTVVQVHPDSASMEYHMKVAGPAFRQFMELVHLSTMDVYGKPSENLLALLGKKAQMLGTGVVAVHKLHAGFTRVHVDGAA